MVPVRNISGSVVDSVKCCVCVSVWSASHSFVQRAEDTLLSWRAYGGQRTAYRSQCGSWGLNYVCPAEPSLQPPRPQVI